MREGGEETRDASCKYLETGNVLAVYFGEEFILRNISPHPLTSPAVHSNARYCTRRWGWRWDWVSGSNRGNNMVNWETVTSCWSCFHRYVLISLFAPLLELFRYRRQPPPIFHSLACSPIRHDSPTTCLRIKLLFPHVCYCHLKRCKRRWYTIHFRILPSPSLTDQAKTHPQHQSTYLACKQRNSVDTFYFFFIKEFFPFSQFIGYLQSEVI